MADKSKLGAKLAAGKFVAFVEILPPRGVDASREIAGARLCAAHGIDCINVPDGPRASARMSAQAACQLIQREAGIEAINHFCCRDRNILGIQSELLGAHAVGVRNLICITGDPPRMGSYPDATAVFDVDAIGLVNIVHNLNHGLDIGGNPMGSQTALLIGVGANPGAVNLDEEIRRFEWKVEAGRGVRHHPAGVRPGPAGGVPEAHRARADSGDLRHLAAHQLPQRRIHGERAARAGSGGVHGAHAARG